MKLPGAGRWQGHFQNTISVAQSKVGLAGLAGDDYDIVVQLI